MKTNRILFFFILVLLPLQILAQGSESVEMADAIRKDGKIYAVVLCLVIILTGVLIFLLRVDRKLHKMERKMKSEIKN